MNPRRTRAVATALALVVSSCSGVDLSPAAIEQAHAPADLCRDAAQTWRDAVVLANEFLASEDRLTLPPGRFELDEHAGMRFVSPLGTWPIAVTCNWWGDVCVLCGFAAQEREYGFVVGEIKPERDRLVDNSFFVFGSGWRKPGNDVAELFLHETTHRVWREGTIGFWNGVAYYLEAIFLFRYSNHSDERKANATSEEFGWWFAHRQMAEEQGAELATTVHDYRDQHLREKHDECTHGPFADPPPPAPIPPDDHASR